MVGQWLDIYLSYGRFNWLKNVDNFDVNSIMKKVDIGYILEIDLEYSDELHVLQKNYPLDPRNFAILMTCCQIIIKKLQTNLK